MGREVQRCLSSLVSPDPWWVRHSHVGPLKSSEETKLDTLFSFPILTGETDADLRRTIGSGRTVTSSNLFQTPEVQGMVSSSLQGIPYRSSTIVVCEFAPFARRVSDCSTWDGRLWIRWSLWFLVSAGTVQWKVTLEIFDFVSQNRDTFVKQETETSEVGYSQIYIGRVPKRMRRNHTLSLYFKSNL